MSECHFVVLDRHYRVLWHGSASSPYQAVRAAKDSPIDWPDSDVVQVVAVHSSPKVGPKSVRSALAHGAPLGTFKGGAYVRGSARAA